MKFNSIVLVLFFATFGAFAQDNATKKSFDFKQNEIKVNAINLIAGALFEVTYERVINEESGAGIAISSLLERQGDVSKIFQVTPYYRFYFGKKPAAGFFMEGFGTYLSATQISTNYYFGGYYPAEETINATGLGIALGGKWVTRKGILFEVYGGVGRALALSSTLKNRQFDSGDKILGRFGITVGYRF